MAVNQLGNYRAAAQASIAAVQLCRRPARCLNAPDQGIRKCIWLSKSIQIAGTLCMAVTTERLLCARNRTFELAATTDRFGSLRDSRRRRPKSGRPAGRFNRVSAPRGATVWLGLTAGALEETANRQADGANLRPDVLVDARAEGRKRPRNRALDRDRPGTACRGGRLRGLGWISQRTFNGPNAEARS